MLFMFYKNLWEFMNTSKIKSKSGFESSNVWLNASRSSHSKRIFIFVLEIEEPEWWLNMKYGNKVHKGKNSAQ